MQRAAACLSVLFLLSPLQVRAGPDASEMADEVSDNVAMEYVECAAYFSVVRGGLEKAGKTEVAQQYAEASMTAAERGLVAAQVSRNDEMAAKVTVARFENSLTSMMGTIEANYSNIALLSSQYSDSCIETMNDPNGVVARWVAKISAKYESEATD